MAALCSLLALPGVTATWIDCVTTKCSSPQSQKKSNFIHLTIKKCTHDTSSCNVSLSHRIYNDNESYYLLSYIDTQFVIRDVGFSQIPWEIICKFTCEEGSGCVVGNLSPWPKAHQIWAGQTMTHLFSFFQLFSNFLMCIQGARKTWLQGFCVNYHIGVGVYDHIIPFLKLHQGYPRQLMLILGKWPYNTYS